MVLYPPTQDQQQEQSLTGDENHATMTPQTDAAASSHINPLNFHVSARMHPQNRTTSWDALLDTIHQIQVDEQRESEAAEVLRQFPPVLLSEIGRAHV